MQSRNMAKVEMLNVSPAEKLIFPQYQQIKVSIIIPVFNNQQLVLDCLKHVLQFTKKIPYEVIIADDHSTADMSCLYSQVQNVLFLQQPDNKGFVKNCNEAAKQARGEYIVLLNSDTLVQKDWLYWLIHVTNLYPKAGIVTGLFLYTDGKIENAGNILFRDGSAMSYGRGDMFPDSSEYQYLKEVDYASATCLLIKKALWEQLGGFNEVYAPAYYEDTDLSFRVRQIGYSVLYQPLARIIHRESQSYLSAKASLLEKNRKLFLNHWDKDLVRAASAIEVGDTYTQHWLLHRAYFRYRDRSYMVFSSFILLDHCTQINIKQLQKNIERILQKGHHLAIGIASSQLLPEAYICELRQKGINVVDDKRLQEWVQHNINNYDDIYIPEKYPQRYTAHLLQYKKKTARVIVNSFKFGFANILFADVLIVLWKMMIGLFKMRFLGWCSNVCAVISRQGIYPVFEGMAAKVSNTFEYFAKHFDYSVLITESPETYCICYQPGEVLDYSFPEGLTVLISFLQKLLGKQFLTEVGEWIFPEAERFLEYPKYDFDFRMRVLYLSCCHGIKLFQSEFYCFEYTLGLVKRLVPGCYSFVSQHNIEFKRLPALYPCTAEQIKKIMDYEIAACNRSNGVIVVSDDDKQSLLATGRIKVPVKVLPLGVDLYTYKTLYANCRNIIRSRYKVPQESLVVIFHGILSYGPNRDAAEYLIQEIFPLLENAFHKNVYLMIVGKHPPRQYMGSHPNIIITDMVDNIAEVISSADFAIVPLQQGGGMRLKILEYFAARVPVISTVKGAAGIPAISGKELILCETSEEIIMSIQELKTNAKKRNALIDAAYEFVQKYDWPGLVAKNVEILKNT